MSKILQAQKVRREMLEIIERRGSFYDCELHSPDETDIWDQNELIIANTEGATVDEALAQAWVAMQVSPIAHCDGTRQLLGMARREDFAGICEAGKDGFPSWEIACLFSVVRTLHGIVAGRNVDRSEWDAALADAEAKRAASDAQPEESLGELGDLDEPACEAEYHLIKNVPAPDALAVARKLEIARGLLEGAEFSEDIIDHAIAELRRIEGQAV